MLPKIEVIDVIDDRLKMNSFSDIKTYKGGNVSYETASVVGSSANNTKNSFNISLTPSNFLDRQPILHAKFTATIPITTTGDLAENDPVIISGADVSVASYPFQRMLGVCDVKLNSQAVCSIELGRHIDDILNVSDVENNNKYGICPSALEKGFINRSDAFLTNSDVFASFNEATPNFIPNGAWNVITFSGTGIASSGVASGAIATGANPVITMTIETYEPLLLPPFLQNERQKEHSLFALNNLYINMTTDSSLISRVFRTQTKNGVNAYSLGVFKNSVQLNWNNLAFGKISTLELLYKTMPLPSIKNFVVPKINQVNTWDIVNNYITANDLTKASINKVAFTGMPHRIMIYASPVAQPPSSKSRYYYQISDLKVNMSGWLQNMCSNANSFELYRMSVDAGLKQDYLTWSGQAYALKFGANGEPSPQTSLVPLVGGPIVLIPNISFPLPDGISCGSAGNFVFDFACAVNNNSGDGATTCNLNVIAFYDNIVSIDTTTLQTTISHPELSVAQMEKQKVEEQNISQEHPEDQVGGFLSKMSVSKSAKNRMRKY